MSHNKSKHYDWMICLLRLFQSIFSPFTYFFFHSFTICLFKKIVCSKELQIVWILHVASLVIKKMCSFAPCIVYKVLISSKGLTRFRFNFSKIISSVALILPSGDTQCLVVSLFVALVTNDEHLDPLFHKACKW